MPVQAGPPRDWLVWADVRWSSLTRYSFSANALNPLQATTQNQLYGEQINTIVGVTRRVSPTFLLGALAGYETFDYRSDELQGRLHGQGWTVGGYLGWKFAEHLRFDAAAAYSGVTYDGSAGQAFGKFNGDRVTLSSGVIGTFALAGFAIEPSAKVYALWEHENAYVDSLGTPQDARTFMTGRASAGLKAGYAIDPGYGMILTPYAGLYADYYLTGDDTGSTVTTPGGVGVPLQPVLHGASARAVAGVAVDVFGATIGLDAERGGIGGNYRTWTGRLSGASSSKTQRRVSM